LENRKSQAKEEEKSQPSQKEEIDSYYILPKIASCDLWYEYF